MNTNAAQALLSKKLLELTVSFRRVNSKDPHGNEIPGTMCNKVEIIRAMRAVSGLGLKEAKDLVDERLPDGYGWAIVNMIVTMERFGELSFELATRPLLREGFSIDSVDRHHPPLNPKLDFSK